MPTQEIQTATTDQLKILKVIRELMNKIGENLPFGHGMRSYANMETRKGIYETEKKFPRAYLYPLNLSDSISSDGQLRTFYKCTIDFLTVSKMSDSQEVLEAKLCEMFRLSSEFLTKLANHEDTMKMMNIEREPLYHVFDANLAGWLITFDIELYGEPIC
jgi:hypothetical protein